MSATPRSNDEQDQRDEDAAQDALNSIIDSEFINCALDISHDHKEGENWFCPVDFPEARMG